MSEDPSNQVVLDEDERGFLRAALLDWGGPARPTDELAVAMGFTDAASLSSEAWVLWQRIEADESLTPGEWKRVLLGGKGHSDNVRAPVRDGSAGLVTQECRASACCRRDSPTG